MRIRNAVKTATVVFFCLGLVHTPVCFSQPIRPHQAAMITQADYVIITPLRYVQVMQSLAAFRQARNGFTVATVTTEEIYSTFGQGIPPDSAIRNFITFTLTGGWTDPRPQFFLLAGGVNDVPSHKEPGLDFPPTVSEDSVHIDQWLVEGVPDTAGPRPAAAVGRFPARDSLALATMVAKTIAYESSTDSSWFGRTLIAADYTIEAGHLFEELAQVLQEGLFAAWADTLTVHLRESSPLYRTRQQFRSLWNQGAAIVGLVGHCNWMQFSGSAFFTTWDVDSLAENSPLAFCTLEASQRFERVDTFPIAVSLLHTPSRGAVATLAPSGLVFAHAQNSFWGALYQGMASNPNTPVGNALLDVKRGLLDPANLRRQTLLGDPALVVKNPRTTGIIDPSPVVPSGFILHQNFPNPFNPTTTISFTIPQRATVSVKVLDLLGRDLVTLFAGPLEAGTFSVVWNAHRASSGIYFCEFRAEGYVSIKPMLLLK
jgi:hypothetical protein